MKEMPQYLTPAGKEKLERELERLVTVRRPKWRRSSNRPSKRVT